MTRAERRHEAQKAKARIVRLFTVVMPCNVDLIKDARTFGKFVSTHAACGRDSKNRMMHGVPKIRRSARVIDL